jgi:hypothetical protein
VSKKFIRIVTDDVNVAEQILENGTCGNLINIFNNNYSCSGLSDVDSEGIITAVLIRELE